MSAQQVLHAVGDKLIDPVVNEDVLLAGLFDRDGITDDHVAEVVLAVIREDKTFNVILIGKGEHVGDVVFVAVVNIELLGFAFADEGHTNIGGTTELLFFQYASNNGSNPGAVYGISAAGVDLNGVHES